MQYFLKTILKTLKHCYVRRKKKQKFNYVLYKYKGTELLLMFSDGLGFCIHNVSLINNLCQLSESAKMLTLLKWSEFLIKYLYNIWKLPYRFSKVRDCVLLFWFRGFFLYVQCSCLYRCK